MRQARLIMGMPIRVEIIGIQVGPGIFKKVFDYFNYIDEKFSTYKPGSEISQINRGEKDGDEYSDDAKTVFALAQETKKQTHGYFDISRNGKIDPSGLVKGWAILNAAKILEKEGCKNF